jgi:hypothetical protein
MSKYLEIQKAFEQTLNSKKKKIKLKLDLNASPREERYFILVSYEVSEEKAEIIFVIKDRNQNHTVVYSDIENFDYADNDERLKIWVDFKNSNNSQRFYLFNNECN